MPATDPNVSFDHALAGLRVLDLTRNLAGPFCTMVLGELGADVVKIEEPQRGDDTRAWAPLTESGDSTMFLSANRNKRSVAVNLDSPAGVEIVTDLARNSDVLVDSFRPGALARRGLGCEPLREMNPRLIYCSISAFGSAGPRSSEPGYDPVIQAVSGIMSITGESDGPPARLGIGAVDLGAGLWAVVGILTALAERERTGTGCRVDTSLFETAAWWLSYHLAGYLATGAVPGRFGSASPSIAPYEAFPTQDGDLFVAAANDNMFRTLCEVIDLRDLPTDPRFESNPLRVENVTQLRSLIINRLSAKPATEWEQILKKRSLPCSRVATVADFSMDPQLAALGMLLPGLGASHGNGLRLVATPLTANGDRAAAKLTPPLLGEHTDAVLGELGRTRDEIDALREQGIIR